MASILSQLAAGLQEKQEEIQANKQNVKDLNAKIQQGDKEIEKVYEVKSLISWGNQPFKKWTNQKERPWQFVLDLILIC